jgi:hypothetical protein
VSFKIGKPGSRGFDKNEHNGHRVAFVNPQGEKEPKFNASEGDQLVAVVDYAICESCKLVYADQRIYGEVLAHQIVDPGEEVVAGWLGQSKARPGKSPAWILEDPTGEDEAAIQSFLVTCNAQRVPNSNRITLEQPKPALSDDKSF